MKVWIINSFVYEGKGGNPAGVVLDLDHSLTESDMQAIAAKVNLSETAFIGKGTEGADFDLRFFTPTDEVPLCGHATIASFWHLAMLGLLTSDTCIQNTKAGHLSIDISRNESNAITVTMEQTAPIIVKQGLTFDASFKASFPNASIDANLPIDIWSTGLEDILLPIESRETLNALIFVPKNLTELSQDLQVVGVHAFSYDGRQVYARNFAPLYGIDEESATGTSNGALTAYLHHHLHQDKRKLELRVLQGERMGEMSAIYTRSEKGLAGLKIHVGGRCAYTGEMDV
jgi:PhzF family phenazine biosynthesis protein